MTLSQPLCGKTPIAVLTGHGEFNLDAAIPLEANIIELYIDATSVNEQFDEAVFCFTDDTASAIRNGGVPTPSAGAAAVLSAFRKRMRSRRETPVSGTEATLNGAFMDNIDADFLAGLLNRDRPEFFCAYMKGNRFKDLRFHIRPFGGVPQLLSPEEVALINYSPRGMKEGIWYLAHRKLEYENGSANSLEDPRVVDVKHYKIDANIASNRHLSATAEIFFEALHNGTRVVKFGLVPSLRVTDVTFEDAPAHFVQTGEEKDSGFYVILPLVLTKGREYRLVVNYSGDKVIRTAGGGNLSVGARSSWYPSIGSFVDRATYELNFSYPKRFVLVSVGNRVDEGVSGKTAHSSWRSDVELKVAGFNLGDFKRMAIEDETTGMVYEGYATKRPPAPLSQMVMSPTPMMKAAVFKSLSPGDGATGQVHSVLATVSGSDSRDEPVRFQDQ